MGSGRGGGSKTNYGSAAAVGSGVGLQSIPAGSRKVVQDLKEIVNCPEPEIYAALKECNMDPNEAVNRLLSQDPFREVKSKREKKKENKEAPESRSRVGGPTSNRGRSGADRYTARGGNIQHSASESLSHGKPLYKKENGSVSNSSLLPSSGVAGNNASRKAPLYSDANANEVKVPSMVMPDKVASGSQPSGYQSTRGGVPGQVSMADIVKMGKPQSKVSSAPNASHNVNHRHFQGPSSAPYQSLQSSEDHISKVSEEHLDTRASSVQNVSVDDEWTLFEPPAIPSIPKPHVVTEMHPESSCGPFDAVNSVSDLDEVQAAGDGTIEDHDTNHVGDASVSGRKLLEDNAEGESLFENDLYRNRESYQPQGHAFDHHGAESASLSVSPVTTNLQQLNLKKEDVVLPPEREGPSVVIPDHLQVQSADCSHLSFGTFGSCVTAGFSGPSVFMPVKANLEETPLEADASSVGHSETRNSEYYTEEPLRNTSEGNLYHRAGTATGSHDPSAASQPEQLKVENLEVDRGNQYAFPSSTSGYAFENSQQLNMGFSESQTSSQMQNISPFSNVMPAYTNSLPNSLLAGNLPPGRESDIPYSPFPVTQSMATKYGNIVSSIGGPSISINEVLKNGGFASTQQPAQTLPGNNVATGPALPQHLAASPYSQPTLPLGPFTNMIGYPFLPQSYAYMPSAFQHVFAGNSTYHQSLAAVLPQYKNSVSVSSLPQSAAVASGYGSFGNSTTIPGNFQMNPAAAPSGSSLGYDDVLNAQYKDSSLLISLQQQSENSGMWLHGAGSRTMSGVPANTYYSFQGQSQQPSGFRQAQQPSQNYGALGYPNFYHSQTGMSLEHQQQNPRDGSFGGSQGQPKPSQQIWQNNY